MKTKNNIIKAFLAVTILILSGCETFDLDQTENPSTPDKNLLDPVYAFNYAQLTLPDFVDSANSFTQRVTRQMAMTGGNTYENAFAGVNFNANWTTGYLILNAIKTMEPKAQQNGQTFILGASKVIRCYVLMTLVDMYGDIPYSEALQGLEGNLTPRYDNDKDVYAGIYNELNDAIALLNSPNSDAAGKARDLYYGGEKGNAAPSKWVTVAKTLKLKMLNNARLVGSVGTFSVDAEATLLMNENDLIDTKEEDFAFKYGTNRVNPNSRHPLYNDQYEANGGAYLGNYFIWAVATEKGAIKDPREFYYFFKQSSSTTAQLSTQTLPCKDDGRQNPKYLLEEYGSFYNTALTPFCTVVGASSGATYVGRDHGDASGIPNDANVRTVAGLYPIGGSIGVSNTAADVQQNGTSGALGEGIMPIMLTSYTHFIKAELHHTVFADPILARADLKKAIEESIDKVTTFLPDQPGEVPPTASEITTYVNFVLAKYDDVSVSKQLELIIKEYYIAAWGNGIEPYNSYRRTGYPSNFQPVLEEISGAYYNTAFYSDYSVNNNPNTPSSVRTRRVFWDVANLELH